MKEKISKTIIWGLSGFFFLCALWALYNKDYYTTIICVLIAVLSSPYIQDRASNGIGGYFQEVRLIITCLGCLFCLAVVQVYIEQASTPGANQDIIFQRAEALLKIVGYILYLCTIFLYREESQLKSYIVFGVVYAISICLSYVPKCDYSTVASILGKILFMENLDVETYILLVEGILVPVKEAFLTYIIFDTVLHARTKKNLQNSVMTSSVEFEEEYNFDAVVNDKFTGDIFNYMINIQKKHSE